MLRDIWHFIIDQTIDHINGLVISSCIGLVSIAINNTAVPYALSEAYKRQNHFTTLINLLEAIETILWVVGIIGCLTIPFSLIGIITKHARTRR